MPEASTAQKQNQITKPTTNNKINNKMIVIVQLSRLLPVIWMNVLYLYL